MSKPTRNGTKTIKALLRKVCKDVRLHPNKRMEAIIALARIEGLDIFEDKRPVKEIEVDEVSKEVLAAMEVS